MIDTELEKEILWQTIRELTFTPTISIPVLAESAAENKMGRKNYDIDTKGRKLPNEYENGYKRFQRLLGILTKQKEPFQPVSELLNLPKIYDNELNTKRIDLYNYMADQLGWQRIRKNYLPVHTLIETAMLDGGNPNDEVICKYYPYYHYGQRTGVDFIEYILLLNISLTTRSRTQSFFERQIECVTDEKRVKQWLEDVSGSMRSESVYMSYVDTFFSVLTYVVSKRFDGQIDNSKKMPNGPEEDGYDYYRQNCLFQAMELQGIQDISVAAWYIMNSDNKFNYKAMKDKRQIEYFGENTRTQSNEYVAIIHEYIDRAISAAESILSTLFNN